MKKIVTLGLSLFVLSTCKTIEDNNIVGGQGDSIGFSTTKCTFDAQGGTVVITSQGANWGLSRYVGIGDKHYLMPRCPDGGIAMLVEESHLEQDNDTTAVAECGEDFITRFKGRWFTITRETQQKLIISVMPNDSKETRTIILAAQDGDFGTYIDIIQSAD